MGVDALDILIDSQSDKQVFAQEKVRSPLGNTISAVQVQDLGNPAKGRDSAGSY